MHSDWFNGIEILQGRWQHGEKVGYCYPSGLEKTLCKWDINVPLVTKGLKRHWKKSASHLIQSSTGIQRVFTTQCLINPLNAELKPICHLMALLGAHLIFHVNRIRVTSHRNLICSCHLYFYKYCKHSTTKTEKKPIFCLQVKWGSCLLRFKVPCFFIHLFFFFPFCSYFVAYLFLGVFLLSLFCSLM